MAGAIRRMATYLGLVEDDQFYTDAEPAQSARNAHVREDRVAVSEQPGTASATPTRGTEATVHDLARPWERSGYRIPVVLPTTYNDARRIGEEFRHNSPVIMDLTGMTDADAKRIVDFAAGLVFGLHGMIERISQKIFLLTPEGVDVSVLAHQQVGEGFGAR